MMRMHAPIRMLYFGINPPDKSMRDAPYLAGLRAEGVHIVECYDGSPGLRKFVNLVKKYRALSEDFDFMFVGHTSTTVVPLARLLTRRPIVFNALNPLYDGMVLEREAYRPLSPRAWMIWLLDFLSFICASAILLETDRQKEYVHSHFFVPRRKLFRVFTTTDPGEYHPDPSIPKDPGFLCVFRGWLTPATGAEYIVEAARLLKDTGIRFRFIVRGQSVPMIQALVSKYALSNVEILEGYHPAEELRRLILSGHVYLGQFSTHPRLDKTIQFKTVEACAYGMPYITADMPSNRELLHDTIDCLFVRRADARDIADKILVLRDDANLRERLSVAARALYLRELAPDVLARQILRIADTLV